MTSASALRFRGDVRMDNIRGVRPDEDGSGVRGTAFQIT